MENQIAIMRKVYLISDTDLYPLAEEEAEKWVDCPQLPLNDVFRKFLTGLHVYSQNGSKYLVEFLDLNLSYLMAERQKPVGELFKLFRGLKALVKFEDIIPEVCANEKEQKLFALDALTKEFFQHFIAHVEYTWALKYDRRYSVRGAR